MNGRPFAGLNKATGTAAGELQPCPAAVQSVTNTLLRLWEDGAGLRRRGWTLNFL